MKNRVKLLRTAKKWSQAELARQLEVSRQSVIAIESERSDPSLALAFRIATLFQVKLEELFRPE